MDSPSLDLAGTLHELLPVLLAVAVVAVIVAVPLVSRRWLPARQRGGRYYPGRRMLVACLNGDCRNVRTLSPRRARRLTKGKETSTCYFDADFAFYGALVDLQCPRCGFGSAWVEVPLGGRR